MNKKIGLILGMGGLMSAFTASATMWYCAAFNPCGNPVAANPPYSCSQTTCDTAHICQVDGGSASCSQAAYWAYCYQANTSGATVGKLPFGPYYCMYIYPPTQIGPYVCESCTLGS